MAIHWTEIDFDNNRQAWNEFRDRGVGASSVPVVLGYNKYKCNLEYFYECIGELVIGIENLRTISGRANEDFTARLWTHFDGDSNSVVRNYLDNRVIRKCEVVNAYCENDDYPYMYASLDRRILPNGSYGYGALELKNTIERVVSQYEGGIVPSHLIQNIVQCVLPEYSYGEVANYIIDSGLFEVWPNYDIASHKEFIEGMVYEIRTFWENVKIARGYYTRKIEYQRNFNFGKAAEMENEIARLEPPVQNTERYKAFLSERFRNREGNRLGGIKGTMEHYQAAKRHRDLAMQIKELTEKMNADEIVLKLAMRDANKMEFGKGQGYISWSPNSVSRPFMNRVI